MTEELRAALEATAMGESAIRDGVKHRSEQRLRWLEVTERLRLKVGALELDLNGDCMGVVLVDGKRLPVQYLFLEIIPGRPPVAQVVFTPVVADDATPPAEGYHPEFIVPCPRPTP